MKMVTGNNCNMCTGICFLIFMFCLSGFTFASVNKDSLDVQDDSLVAEAQSEETLDGEITPAVAPEPKLATTNQAKSLEKKSPLSQDAVKQDAVKIGSGTHLASVALGLVLVVGLILVLAWFMRRFNQGGIFNNSAIKIMAAMPLGTRERLLVVDVAGQQILLGVTATQINTLHVFNEPVIEANNPAGSSDFGRKLLAVLQQKDAAEKSQMNDPS